MLQLTIWLIFLFSCLKLPHHVYTFLLTSLKVAPEFICRAAVMGKSPFWTLLRTLSQAKHSEVSLELSDNSKDQGDDQIA